MTGFLALCRFVARQNDAVNGAGASRADSLAAVFGLTFLAILAVGIAAIGD
ncbi:hypothetical protein [Erythrobacter sp. WG]|uniref:hypothetical protein n=1 Tax=Erythrobacter sp. WG TaxID=2985510 RepID=UPI00226DE645|nr:hypothetical protein [Erythrobacter sp. WG]MCX9146594.1 hypothetical protein [Erythrobacter sp. WG]